MTLVKDKNTDVSSHQKTSITYRAMTSDDLPVAYELSQIVKWPHRIEDWQMAMRLGNSFVAEENNTVIGTAICWSHGEEYSSLGMVIVSPENQGQGIGRKLMNQVLNDIGESKKVMLFATPAGQPLYESFGFKATGEVYQHQAIVENPAPCILNDGENLRTITLSDYDSSIKLAEKACGIGRSNVIKDIMKFGDGIVLEKDGEITGFALIRPFGRGYAIGPIIAPELQSAKKLIQHWLTQYTDKFARIDIPESSELSPWLEEIGLPKVDTVVEMVRGEAPTKSPEIRQFALVSQALG